MRIALRLRVRRDLADLVEAAAGFALAGARAAAQHAETLMVEHTYLQHAQPSTLGHYLLGPSTRRCATSTGSSPSSTSSTAARAGRAGSTAAR